MIALLFVIGCAALESLPADTIQGKVGKKPQKVNKVTTLCRDGIGADLDIVSMVYILAYIRRRAHMKTAKIFRSGNSQAVRIPKEFQLEGDEVEISKRGASLVLRPKRTSWATLFESLEKFSADFMESGRKQPKLQKRSRAFS